MNIVHSARRLAWSSPPHTPASKPRMSADRGLCGHKRTSRRPFLHLVHVSVAVENDIASCRKGGARALLQWAGECFHRDVIAHQQSGKANRATNHVANHS